MNAWEGTGQKAEGRRQKAEGKNIRPDIENQNLNLEPNERSLSSPLRQQISLHFTSSASGSFRLSPNPTVANTSQSSCFYRGLPLKAFLILEVLT